VSAKARPSGPRRSPARGVVAAALAWAVPFGAAQADQELFNRSNCLACHGIDQKRVGPSMKQVAARYRGDAGAPAKLAHKIREGGAGAWGELPMPPQPQVSEADAKALAVYILSLK
jgi:cytochrome c